MAYTFSSCGSRFGLSYIPLGTTMKSGLISFFIDITVWIIAQYHAKQVRTILCIVC